jgi:cytochrome c2
MGTHNRLMTVLFVSLIAIAVDTANAKKSADRGNADAGRDLAVEACTGCHVVSKDQMQTRSGWALTVNLR